MAKLTPMQRLVLRNYTPPNETRAVKDKTSQPELLTRLSKRMMRKSNLQSGLKKKLTKR